MDKKIKDMYDKLNVVTINRDDYNMIIKDRLDFGFDSLYFRYAELCDELAVYKAQLRHSDPLKEREYMNARKMHFYEALEHLVDYVQTPHFTDENVEKEKGIIEQEIKMYNDDPNWNVYFNCLKALYVNYPVKVDIAGTVESIYKITKEELYKCYNTFYNPGNMALFVVGDLDYDKVIQSIRNVNHNDVEILNEEIKRFYPEEPNSINKKEIVAKFPISMPMFNIAFKDNNVGIKGNNLLRKEIVTEILIDMIFRRGSKLYEERNRRRNTCQHQALGRRPERYGR